MKSVVAAAVVAAIVLIVLIVAAPEWAAAEKMGIENLNVRGVGSSQPQRSLKSRVAAANLRRGSSLP